MRLQRQISREYKGTKYEKHWLVVPNDLIDKLGWKVGENLNAEIQADKLVIRQIKRKQDEEK